MLFIVNNVPLLVSKQVQTIILPLQITDANGQLQPLDLVHSQRQSKASEGLEGIDVQAIVDETVKNLYNGVKESDIATTMMMATRTRIEQEPNYTYVTARLLRNELVSTGLEFLGLSTDTLENDALETFLKKGMSLIFFHLIFLI
jgi:ribonucleoside-diphosphate reductase alpha chain